MRGLSGVAAQTQRQAECAAGSVEIDFADESHVAVVRSVEAPRHLLVRLQILPAIGVPDETRGPLQPGSRARQCHGDAMTLGEEHGDALVVTQPGRIPGSVVLEMRREERVHAIVVDAADERMERDRLQNGIAPRVTDNALLDAIAAVKTCVEQSGRWQGRRHAARSPPRAHGVSSSEKKDLPSVTIKPKVADSSRPWKSRCGDK